MKMNFIEATDNAFTGAAPIGAFKGAVKNLSNSDYHGLKSYWSSTQLKFMYETSPAHFEVEYVKPKAPKKDTASKILGALVHTLILTPHEFENEFFLMPSLNLRTNEGRAHKEELLAANAGKMAIDDETLATAHLMRLNVESNDKAMKLLAPGLKEASYFWACPFSGLKFKAKLDQSSSLHFVEMKTTTEVGPENFARQCYNYHYDLSLFHYKQGMIQVLDLDVPAYKIAIETDPPYLVSVYRVPDSYLLTGHDKWLTAVQRLEVALKTEKWGGYYPEDAEPPELPTIDWAVRKHSGGM